MAEKEIRLCKNIAKFRKICLFRLQNFAFWMQNLRFVFAKNRGDRYKKPRLVD